MEYVTIFLWAVQLLYIPVPHFIHSTVRLKNKGVCELPHTDLPILKNSFATASANFSHQAFVGQNTRTDKPSNTVSRLSCIRWSLSFWKYQRSVRFHYKHFLLNLLTLIPLWYVEVTLNNTSTDKIIFSLQNKLWWKTNCVHTCRKMNKIKYCK